MCYFVEINLPRQKLEERFGIPVPEDPRYMPVNFASAFTLPFLPVISLHDAGKVLMYRWGLIPSWVKDEDTAKKILAGTFNARSETIWEKPSFRGSVKNGRCLVLAHGFFEYQEKEGKKIPYYIRLKNNEPFAFAGLSDTWTNRNTGEIIHSCSIVTRQADDFMGKIHNTRKRMPVILRQDTEMHWIDPSLGKGKLEDIINELAPGLMAYRIDKTLITGKYDPTRPEILNQLAGDEEILYSG